MYSGLPMALGGAGLNCKQIVVGAVWVSMGGQCGHVCVQQHARGVKPNQKRMQSVLLCQNGIIFCLRGLP